MKEREEEYARIMWKKYRPEDTLISEPGTEFMRGLVCGGNNITCQFSSFIQHGVHKVCVKLSKCVEIRECLNVRGVLEHGAHEFDRGRVGQESPLEIVLRL